MISQIEKLENLVKLCEDELDILISLAQNMKENIITVHKTTKALIQKDINKTDHNIQKIVLTVLQKLPHVMSATASCYRILFMQGPKDDFIQYLRTEIECCGAGSCFSANSICENDLAKLTVNEEQRNSTDESLNSSLSSLPAPPPGFQNVCQEQQLQLQQNQTQLSAISQIPPQLDTNQYVISQPQLPPPQLQQQLQSQLQPSNANPVPQSQLQPSNANPVPQSSITIPDTQHVESSAKQPTAEAPEDNSYSPLVDPDIRRKLWEIFASPKYESNVFSGAVSEIFNENQRLVFVAVVNKTVAKTIQDLSKAVNLRQYQGMPPMDDVFGLVVDDDSITRAKIISSGPGSANYVAVLLDLGGVEIINSKSVMYQISPDVQAIPPNCAIFCVSNGVSLKSLLYKTYDFEVFSVKFDVPLIKLVSNESEMNGYEKEQTKEKKDLVNSVTQSNENEAKPFQLTEDQKRVLWQEEEFCTSNASKALYGYEAKDDETICPHYDEKIGGCFKGSNCRKRHVKKNPDGWTKDRVLAPTVTYNRFPMNIYEPGSTITIEPTYVSCLNILYAKIKGAPYTHWSHMWDSNSVTKFLKMQQMPYIYDIVIARYTDGMWYRARVHDTDSENLIVSVFYLDYGNYHTVTLDDLRLCDPSTAAMPPCATKCFIANVHDITNDLEERRVHVERFAALTLGKQFDVIVEESHEDLFIRFQDRAIKRLIKEFAKKELIKICESAIYVYRTTNQAKRDESSS